MGETMTLGQAGTREEEPRSGEFKIALVADRQRDEALALVRAKRFAACFAQRSGLEWILSPEGNILEMNAAAAELLGASETSVGGRSFAQALWWSCGPDAEPMVRERVGLAAKGYPARC